MVNDVIGDFLSRIRNAQHRKKETLRVPTSKMLVALCEILKKEKFINDFSKVENEDTKGSEIEVELRYVNDQPVIRTLKRISKPGVRKYRGYREIKPIMNGMGISIFSTPKGIITGEEARKQKTGGEYICDIY